MAENDTTRAVASYLETLGAKFKAEGGHLTARGDWNCYAWRVTFMRGRVAETFDYHAGTAHVYPQKFPRGHWARSPDKPMPPSAADFLYCAVLDSRAADQSFADWCAEFGYSDDSLSALDIYRACCDSTKRLRRVFSAAEFAQIATLTADM